MRIELVSVVSAVVLTSSLASARDWPNEPPGSIVLSDCPMSSLCSGWTHNSGELTFTPDASGPVSAPSALFELHPGSPPRSGAWLTYDIGGAPRELFLGVVTKLSSPFAGYPNYANKILFVVTDGQYQALEFYGYQQDAYPVMWSWTHDGTNNNGHIDDCAPNDNCLLFGSRKHWPVGQYHKIEVYLKFGTTPSSDDGIVRWWVNGEQVGHYTNVNFPGSFFRAIDWTHTWDGETTNPDTFSFTTDHVRLSVPSGAGPDTTAPAAPTGLRVL